MLIVWWLAVVTSPAVLAKGVVIKDAIATLVVDGGEADQKHVVLPHLWDSDYPARNGRARYEMTLPASPDGQAMALYFPRLGNQIEIQVNGEVLARRGVLGDTSFDASKTPYWLSVPASVLNDGESSELVVLASMQANRWGGLSPPLWGTEAQTQPVFRQHYAWRHNVALAVIISLFCVGAVAAALWGIQRDEVFGWFAMAAVFGVIRFTDVITSEPLLPWPLNGGVMAAALQVHSLCMLRFFLALLDFRRFWLNPLTFAVLVIELVAAMAAIMYGEPRHWNWVLGSTLPISLFLLPYILRLALIEHQKPAMLLMFLSLVALLVVVRDLLVVRISGDGPGMIFWSPLITLLFVGVAGWMIIQRFAKQMQLNRELVATLDSKVQQREAELRSSQAQVQSHLTHEATLAERQRITRDIHDGVGAQLVGLLSLVRDGKTDRRELGEHVKAALDELRMAVDSMQPTHQDLTTVLATLRYRQQPRLEAAGIELTWQIGDLPDPDGLSTSARAQVQRIMQEALANVIRHAQASQVSIQASFDANVGNRYLITVEDNGRGFQGLSTVRVGHGLGNMRARAEAIGGQLNIDSIPDKGVRVTLITFAQF